VCGRKLVVVVGRYETGHGTRHHPGVQKACLSLQCHTMSPCLCQMCTACLADVVHETCCCLPCLVCVAHETPRCSLMVSEWARPLPQTAGVPYHPIHLFRAWSILRLARANAPAPIEISTEANAYPHNGNPQRTMLEMCMVHSLVYGHRTPL